MINFLEGTSGIISKKNEVLVDLQAIEQVNFLTLTKNQKGVYFNYIGSIFPFK